MLTYTLKKTPGHPLYEQLYQSIRDDIAAGRLPAGSRLPSKRVLAAHLGVSVVTVESAYAQLLAEGYAEARPRSGVYVCAIGSSAPVQPPHMPSLPQPSAPEPLFDLSGGTGEDVPFPASVWVRTMREVIADKRLMQPVDFAGAPELRAAIAAHLEQARGLRVSPEQIFIGAGTEYLYGLIVQLLGRRLRYAVEDPGYRKISGIYAANDVTVCPIGLDSEGLSVEALRASGAQIAHISPAHHYPTGIVMPIRRRNALLAWAAEAPERYIIEDDLRQRAAPHGPARAAAVQSGRAGPGAVPEHIFPDHRALTAHRLPLPAAAAHGAAAHAARLLRLRRAELRAVHAGAVHRFRRL